ncbi:MAG: family 16 glycosylhydrolase [Anaerolineae bacterium]|nr:family 16 glycosylhydrolase [Anaerolineae bacterium]
MKSNRLFVILAALAVVLLGVFALMGAMGSTRVSAEPVAELTIIDDFEDGDSADWLFFGGNAAGGGGGVLDDHPYEGSYYLSTGWGGEGTASGFYGGAFKNFDNAAQVVPPADPWFSVWVYNQSNATVDQYTLEITIREDLDGNGWTDGEEDSFRLDTVFTSAEFDDQWTQISAPLSSFINLFTGGDGTFNGNLDEVVIVISGVVGGSGSTVEVDFDLFAFTAGEPTIGEFPPVVADFEGGFPADWFVYSSIVNANVINIDGNDVLSVTYDVAGAGFGGFGALLPSQDWTDYQAITFDFFGNNSGLTYTFEAQDGSDPVVERFHGLFVDDFTGWRTILIPFSTFVRGGFQDPGAPDNGFQLNAIKAWVFPLPVSSGEFMLDNIEVTNIDPFADFDPDYPPGWFQYGGTVNPALATVADDSPYAQPGQVGDNGIISGTFDIAGGGVGFGGFGATFAEGRDWSDLDGITYWFYGHNSGDTFTFEIQDGTPGNPVVERFVHTFEDNFDGWQLIVAPWSTFVRGGFQEPGAPDDGLNLIDIRAWAYPLPVSSGSLVLDMFSVFGDAGNVTLKVAFASSEFNVMEGNTATITAALTTFSAETVTVTYATSDGTAVAGSDYTATSGQLVFAPGVTEQAFTVETFDNDENDDARTVILTLSDAENAELGNPNPATLIIGDDETDTPSGKNVIIQDYQTGEIFSGTDPDGNTVGYDYFAGGSSTVSLAITETLPAPVPGSAAGNKALQEHLFVTPGSFAGFSYKFTNETADQWVPQDWSSYSGFGFWLYGNNTGGVIFVDILDNRNPGSTTDDAERFVYDINDDFDGWQYFEIGWDEFVRKDVGNGAPNDGFNLTEVHGYAFGGFGAAPMDNDYYIDDVSLVVRVDVVDDFEDGELPSGTDPNGIPVGYFTVAGGGGSIEASITDTPPTQVPGAPADNNVLDELNTLPPGAFAVFVNAFTNETVDEWVSVDWEGYQGVCFWLYGNNTGGTLFVDVLDNRNPDSTVDDAERWSIDIPDDFDGWQFFQFTWDEFTRKEIGNGAPNDGFNLTEVHGYAIGGYGSVDMGTNNYYYDDFSVWGNSGADVPLTAQYELSDYEVVEGETATITVTLNMSATEAVTVTYASAESYAIPYRDFTPVAGELVFAPGETAASFTVETFDNAKHDGDRNLMLVLYSAENAELGFRRQTVLNILDDDPEDETLINDFEGFHNMQTYGDITLDITELMAGDPDALPGQGTYEQVLDGSYNTDNGPAGFGTTFVGPEDWSLYDGISFWFYGSNSGETYTFELQDNQAATTAETPPDEWVMVWSDEFNTPAGTPPDPTKWTHEIGDGTLNDNPGWGNAEFEFYTDDPANASTDGDGNLVITLDQLPEDTDLICYYGPCEYTSARLITWYKSEFEYGRIESRMKMPTGEDGLWPAFWSLGTDIGEVGWPQTGEIDIMEYVSRVPNEIFGTIHGPGYSGGSSFGGTYDFGEPVANEYHTFTIEWTPDEIHWYVDGINYHNAIPADVAPNEWVFNHPFFLILNFAIGGNFGGSISPDLTFPQETLVDYVRVYQAPNSAERFDATFVDDFTGWQQITLPFIGFTRSATQPDNAPNDGLGLNEVWGYGFQMPDSGDRNPQVAGEFMLDQIRLVTGIPTAIELDDFSAEPQADGSVLVEWITSAEVDNAGFNVIRSSGAFADGVQVNDNLIASTSSAGTGSSYALVDATAPVGTLNYWLVAVATDGTTTTHGPIVVVNQAPTSANLSSLNGSANIWLVPLLLVALVGLLMVGIAFNSKRIR